MRLLSEYFEGIREALYSDLKLDTVVQLEKARELGITNSDFLLGIVQPLLYKIGQMYSANVISVATEHRFSSFIEQVFAHIYATNRTLRASLSKQDRLDLLLVCASGNYHSFGVRIIELILKEHGLNVEAIYPGLPVPEIVKLIVEKRPKLFGLSVSFQEQLEYISQIREGVKKHNLPMPPFLVGGLGLKSIAIENKYDFIETDTSDMNRFVEFIRDLVAKAA